MNLRREITAGAAVLLLAGSVMNVSAAELSSSEYVNKLIESNQESLIIDVDAYKAAYADLADAFGDDSDAYLNHYLTMGVYEGRTKGVLFDPLAYAEAYSDVKTAYGYDITAIVEHYITFGIKENRTQGTANGYADIAAAEKAGVQNASLRRNINIIPATGSTDINNRDGNNTSTGGNYGVVASSNTDSSNVSSNNVINTADSNNVAVSESSNTANNYTASSDTSNYAVNTGAPAGETNNNAESEIVKDYHHTTSIYKDDDTTLWRVEYYDENNNLIKYSDVTYDASNSYKENIYHYDEETQSSVLERTDTYVDGVLTSSENH